MKVTVLGAGTFQPTPERGSAGYLVDTGEVCILLDPGSGSLRQLARCGKTTADIDYVFLTHLHPDHTGDLVPVLFCRSHEPRKQKRDIKVYGPQGFFAFYRAVHDIYGRWIDTDAYDIVVEEYCEGKYKFGGWSVNAVKVEHTDNSHGFRIESGGACVAYSGDTGYCDGLLTLLDNADCAFVECTAGDENPVSGHLTPSEAGKAASTAECRRLVLTHISPGLDECELLESCRKHFPGRVEIARELQPYEFV